ncbi:hypothetical protein ABVK25_002903 [Lepraria finkii]|uniref:Prion-inhibition and propagation HeLo domain-containing protein n=1 Tax=Lepraria finkii TaxID=1340010 RepID=A0ABR4BI93_9LECA
MSILSNVMGAGAFLPPMIQALHSFHGVWQRIGTFGRDFKDTRDTLRIEECRFGEVLNCDLQSLAKIGDTIETVKAVNRQVANIQSHLDSCHEFIDWYDSGASNRDPEQQASGPEVLQSSTGFPRRARWAIIDWQKLHDSLEHIRASIDGLHSLLRLEYSYSPRPSPSKQNKSANSALLPVRKALHRLHRGLACLGDTSESDHQLSIQLREHWDNTSMELSSLTDIEIRDGSYVFSIQKSHSYNPDPDSVLLLVDTRKKVPDSPDDDGMIANLPRLRDLDGPRFLRQGSSSDQRSRVETLGYIPTPQSRSISNDLHIVHQAPTSWRSPLHLAEILSDPSYVEHITPVEIIWLAKLLVTSHLCFLPVQRDLNVQPRPSNYRFYCKPEEDFNPWAENNPLILKPFLSIGFGTNRNQTPGGLSDFNHPPYASVIELGLVLYQIGAGRVIDYGTGRAGLAKAKAKVLRELERDSSVDTFAGSSYVSIIEGCLNMWTRFRLYSDDLAAMQRREMEYLSEVVTQLSDDLQLLEDTVLMEPARASLSTPKTAAPPELVLAGASQCAATTGSDLSHDGQGHRVTVETPEVVSTGVIARSHAVTLDSPDVTETMAEDQILRQLRALTESSGNPPQADSVIRWCRVKDGQSQPVLECPFDRLGCRLQYSDLAGWFWHSLSHFQIDGSFARTLLPPTSNTCCFCEKKFTATMGIDSWRQCLAHYAYHHLHGHSLATAEPDIGLCKYLCDNGLIDQGAYNELRAKSKDSGIPVKKMLILGSAASAPVSQEGRRATVINERRFKMGKGIAWLRGR